MDTTFGVLVVRAQGDGFVDRAFREIEGELGRLGRDVCVAVTLGDARLQVMSDPSAAAVLLDARLLEGDASLDAAGRLLRAVRERTNRLPVYLVAQQGDASAEGPAATELDVKATVYIGEESPEFVAQRVNAAAADYERALLPPFFGQLLRYVDHAPYDWDAPGHMGGAAFLKHPVGSLFHAFCGERLLRGDAGINVSELGSLLDHRGPIGEAEHAAALTFGANRTWFVINGSSASNQIVLQAVVSRDVPVLVDRNCHKSVAFGLVNTGARPGYLAPVRNGLGLLGGIPRQRLAAAADRLRAEHDAARVPYLVITNCTYDGIVYDVAGLGPWLRASVDTVHFDEAWFPYARFSPFYAGRFAMSLDVAGSGLSVYAVQSTHKLLAAFSQGSMIHVKKSPDAGVDDDVFNQAYMMHTSTSPLYPLVASLDVATAMMSGTAGTGLVREAVQHAVALRRQVTRRRAACDDWFFGVWQPAAGRHPGTGDLTPFDALDDEALVEHPELWAVEPGAEWHGFAGLAGDDRWLLDPTKVTLLCPGADASGRYEAFGVPAAVVVRYLAARHSIEISKAGDYTILVQVSIGMRKAQIDALVDALDAFKELHDQGATIGYCMPELLAGASHQYATMTLPELCRAMHEEHRRVDLAALMEAACAAEPEVATTPADAYRAMVEGRSRCVGLEDAVGRVAAVMVVPYPPGIPVVMPGERITAESVAYLAGLEELSRRFPGFSREVHGIREEGDRYLVRCL